jgi:hypothetical protein
MIRSLEDATSESMQRALRARLGEDVGSELLRAHLYSAYQRLAYSAHGARMHLQSASILPRDVAPMPVDEGAVLSLAVALFGTRLDSVAYVPGEHGEREPLQPAPVATRQSRRRELSGTPFFD